MAVSNVFLIFILILAKADINLGIKNKTVTDIPSAFRKNDAVNMTENNEELKKSFVNATKFENDKQIYLEDVFSNLKNTKWEDGQEICLNQIMLMLKSIQNYTLWAVWMWDSISSEPYGLFSGSKHHLGNFEQCLYPPWSPQEVRFSNQYCLAEVILGRKGNDEKSVNVIGAVDPHQSALDYLQTNKYRRSLNELTWGVCVPSSCSQKSVQKLLQVLLLRSHLGITETEIEITVDGKCQRAETNKVDAVSTAFICIISTFILMTLFCTYVANQQWQINKNSLSTLIVKTFCMKNNITSLKNFKNDGLQLLYGIRFISICVIVLGHQLGFTLAGPVSNGRAYEMDYFSYYGILMVRHDLNVDTFFWMSGLLSFRTLISLKKLPNPLILILRRYVRLAVGLGVVIFLLSGPFALLGSGPLWARVVSAETETCRKNWWLNMVMLNNYIDIENQCYPISWYIPCDFHYFVVTVIVCCIWRRNKYLSIAFATLLGLASTVALGVITYASELPAVIILYRDFFENPRGDLQFDLTYIKSHTRFGAYFVGMVAGYVVNVCSLRRLQICKMFSIILACCALALMAATVFLGWMLVSYSHSALINAIYAALSRPVWAIGLSILLVCCTFGSVPIVTPFLQWHVWASLSRLVYGVYLIHGILISRNVGTARNPKHYEKGELLVVSAGVLVWCFLLAFVQWLFIEAPINNLLGLCLSLGSDSSSRKKKKQDEENCEEIENTKEQYIQKL